MVASSRRHSVRVAQVYLYVGCMARCARVRGCSLCSPRRARATAVPGPRAASTRWQLYAARDATRGGRFCVLSPLAFRHTDRDTPSPTFGKLLRGIAFSFLIYLKREQKNSYTLIDKPCALPVTPFTPPTRDRVPYTDCRVALIQVDQVATLSCSCRVSVPSAATAAKRWTSTNSLETGPPQTNVQ